MNTVFIVPTGVGAEIGGHAGDATPAAKLLASVSDLLITHPNVVNASDINEMTENTLYVEGSMLDRFLGGEIELERVHHNRILLAVNTPVDNKTINAVSAARATIGADITIMELKTPLVMIAEKDGEKATGTVSGVVELIDQVRVHDFDALAIATHVAVAGGIVLDYLDNGGVNPWGGVEAVLSRIVSEALNKPVAHAPFLDKANEAIFEEYDQVVDPRMAAELVSRCYLHCVLKGLHRAPRIGKGLSVNDVDCMVSPSGLSGLPHAMCVDRKIPIIIVEENRTRFNYSWSSLIYEKAIKAATYLEAAGIVACMRAGIDWRTVLRPLAPTVVIKSGGLK